MGTNLVKCTQYQTKKLNPMKGLVQSWFPRCDVIAAVYVALTECPKIYRKSVLHLLKQTANLYYKIQSFL